MERVRNPWVESLENVVEVARRDDFRFQSESHLSELKIVPDA
jgi:hypothetical protein